MPRATGGDDDPGNLVSICATCHQAVHNIAHMARAGQKQAAKDAIHVLAQGHQASIDRFLELIQVELSSVAAGGKQAKQPVTLVLERPLYDALKGISQTLSKPGSSKPIGLNRLLNEILAQWVVRYTQQHEIAVEPSAIHSRPDICKRKV